MNNCASGPIATAYATVPRPTVPPSRNPIPSTSTSMPVRTSRIDNRGKRPTRPVISPSRGQGTMLLPM